MNTDPMQPLTEKLSETLGQVYRLALTHAIEVIKQNYIPGHVVVTPVLDNIIHQLKKLQK